MVAFYGCMYYAALRPEEATDLRLGNVANLPDDDFRKRHRNFQGAALERNLRLVELLREIGAPHQKSPGEVAVAWTLRHSAVTATIVGARNPQQIEGTIGAATWRLPEEDVTRLEKFLQQNPA